MSEAWVNPGNLASHVVNPQANIIIRSREGEASNTGHLPKSLVHFYKGEPEALGATQIFSGLVLLVCGIALMVATDMHFPNQAIVFYSGLPIWSGVIYIFCGTISVAASVKPTMGKVRAILVMNIFSSLAAGCGIIIILISVSLPFSTYRNKHCIYQPNEPCKGEFDEQGVMKGLVSIFLLFISLMFCVSITNSVFGCKTACRTAFSEVNLVLYQTTTVNAPDTNEAAPLPAFDPLSIPKSSRDPQDN